MNVKTIIGYLASEIHSATAFVSVAFLALFAFFDLVSELGDIGKGRYTFIHAIAYVCLSLPAHFYELAPVAVLIGTLYALSSLAANSEFVIMRSAGLTPVGVAGMLLRVGAVFAVLTFVFGELISPASERAAREWKLRKTSTLVAQEFRSGLWVRDDYRFVNVREVLPDASLSGIRIFEFDSNYRLLSISEIGRGEYTSRSEWELTGVVRTSFGQGGASVDWFARMSWTSALTPDMLTVLFVVPERMSAWALYQYLKHLSGNQQKTERYEIAFWKKLLYPFAALVMMMLALPFAYIHTRTGGVGAKVFAGVMLGVLFHMLNSLFSHLGLLQGWQPLLSAASPSVFFLAAAAGMMWWVERR